MVSRSTPGERCYAERHNGKWMNRDAGETDGGCARAFGVKRGEGIGTGKRGTRGAVIGSAGTTAL